VHSKGSTFTCVTRAAAMVAAAKPAPKRVSQAAFDACVQEYVEDLGLSPEDALEEAMVSYSLQGVDLSNLRTTLPGEGGRTALRSVVACRALAAALDSGEGPAALRDALRSLAAELYGPDVQPAALEAAGAPRRRAERFLAPDCGSRRRGGRSGARAARRQPACWRRRARRVAASALHPEGAPRPLARLVQNGS